MIICYYRPSKLITVNFPNCFSNDYLFVLWGHWCLCCTISLVSWWTDKDCLKFLEPNQSKENYSLSLPLAVSCGTSSAPCQTTYVSALAFTSRLHGAPRLVLQTTEIYFSHSWRLEARLGCQHCWVLMRVLFQISDHWLLAVSLHGGRGRDLSSLFYKTTNPSDERLCSHDLITSWRP